MQRVRDLADDLNTTPGRIALAWLLAQGDDVIPIPGTRRRTNLEDNLGAVTVTLPEAAVESLDALLASGERYADMAWVAGTSV